MKRPADWLRAISRYRGTVSFAPNFAYDLCVRRVRDHDLEGLDLSCWRVAGCGAEPIHAPTLAAFAAEFAPVGFRETSFVPSYGLAEHVLAATFAPRARELRVEHLASDELAERRVATPVDGPDAERVTIVSCGRPLPGHKIRVVDEQDRPVVRPLREATERKRPAGSGAEQRMVLAKRHGPREDKGQVGYQCDAPVRRA